MIERLTRSLIDVGLPLAPEEVADVLWLAAQLAGENSQSAANQPIREERETGFDPGGASETAPIARMDSVSLSQPAEEQVRENAEFATTMVAGNYTNGVFRIPGVAATGMAANIAQPLQAFSKRFPSRTTKVIDEEATAEEAATTGHWMPVMVPERDYRFDLLLVVDESETSPLWSDLVNEFARMLSKQTAFRHVNRLSLISVSDGQLRDGRGKLARLTNWHGRRTTQVVIVSDTMSQHWLDGSMQKLLHSWLEIGPVTLLQPMPRATWRYLPLGVPDLRLASQTVVQHNSQFNVEDDDDVGTVVRGGLAIPVIGFDVSSLQRWANVMTGHPNAHVVGLYIATELNEMLSPTSRRTSSDEIHGGQKRVALFRQMASPEAYNLAVHLSVMEKMTIPVMRLIQRIMHPHSGAGEMAEVFLGGLIEKVAPEEGEGPDAEFVYRIDPDVRKVLTTSRRRSDERTIKYRLEAVSNQLPANDSSAPVKAGFFLSPASSEHVTEWVLPFSAVSRKVLSEFTAYQQDRIPSQPSIAFNRENAILAQRLIVGNAALNSKYAMLDDRVLGDIPLIVESAGSLWLVCLIRYVLILSSEGNVAAAFQVENLVLVEATDMGHGRGRLDFHQQSRAIEYDTQVWKSTFELERAVKNLGMIAQVEKNRELQGILLQQQLVLEKLPLDLELLKIEANHVDQAQLRKHWGTDDFFALQAGWFSSMRQKMLHTYRSLANHSEIFDEMLMVIEPPKPAFYTVPIRLPVEANLIQMSQSQISAAMAAMEMLEFDSARGVEVMCNILRSMFPSANGVSWLNVGLHGLITHSLFIESIRLDDIFYGNPIKVGDSNADLNEAEDMVEDDMFSLAQWLTEAVDNDDVPGFEKAILTELNAAVDRVDWNIEADSYMSVETDDAHGVLQDWEFGDWPNQEFEPIDYSDGKLIVRRVVVLSILISGSFSFSVRDSIDKDMMYMGSTDLEKVREINIEVEFEFSGVAEKKPELEYIEIGKISGDIDFGTIEPDFSDHEPDEDQ